VKHSFTIKILLNILRKEGEKLQHRTELLAVQCNQIRKKRCHRLKKPIFLSIHFVSYSYLLFTKVKNWCCKFSCQLTNKMQQQEVRDENIRNNGGEREEKEENAPPLMALNHVSRLCRNLKESIDFYTKVLGFVETERPQALDVEGAWLFNYGVGIHLVQSKEEEEDQRLPSDAQHLDPQDNHISFQV